MSIAALDTRKKKEWLFAPFEWALYSTLLAIVPLVGWYQGVDHPTPTILSLAGVVLIQSVCILWGVLRVRRATRGY
jgi:hypothetical protein